MTRTEPKKQLRELSDAAATFVRQSAEHLRELLVDAGACVPEEPPSVVLSTPIDRVADFSFGPLPHVHVSGSESITDTQFTLVQVKYFMGKEFHRRSVYTQPKSIQRLYGKEVCLVVGLGDSGTGLSRVLEQRHELSKRHLSEKFIIPFDDFVMIRPADGASNIMKPFERGIRLQLEDHLVVPVGRLPKAGIKVWNLHEIAEVSAGWEEVSWLQIPRSNEGSPIALAEPWDIEDSTSPLVILHFSEQTTR